MTQADTQSAPHSTLIRPAASDGFALGLGLTNECNLACSFCYRDPVRTDRLSLEQVRSVMESLQLNAPLRRTQHHPAHQGKGPREGKKLLFCQSARNVFSQESTPHSPLFRISSLLLGPVRSLARRAP